MLLYRLKSFFYKLRSWDLARGPSGDNTHFHGIAFEKGFRSLKKKTVWKPVDYVVYGFLFVLA